MCTTFLLTGAEKVGTYRGAKIELRAKLGAREVVLLKVVKSN